MSKVNGRNASPLIAARIPFNSHGALRAVTLEPGRKAYPLGILPGQYREQLDAEMPSYVVYSYETPIAWWSEAHGWTRPNVRYSMTTSHHQGRCPRGDDKVSAQVTS